MAKIGRDFRLKRQMAPTFWNIKRKKSQFVLRVKPGTHPQTRAYPLGIIMRDVLKIANTMHEAEIIVNAGKVKVDGIIRRDIHFGVGLMDIVELAPTGQAYRFVPKDSKLLVPVSIRDDEKLKKLVKITNKAVIRQGKIQYGFHDGKTLISDQNMSVGDTCLVQLPESKITEHLKFERGSTVLVTSGENAGGIGKIEDIRDGIFSLPKHALVSFVERSVELPVEIVMTVGSQRPIIGVN